MKRVRWTRHALEALAEREIDRAEAEKAIHEPTAAVSGHWNRTVHLRKCRDPVLNQEMLLCVVTEAQDDEIVIVTLYKTSKIGKYLKGDAS